MAFMMFGDFFLLDWRFKEKYTNRIMVKGTEDCDNWKTGPWMRNFDIVDHWVKTFLFTCPLVSFITGEIGMLIR
jgi:hypothetical protein